MRFHAGMVGMFAALGMAVAGCGGPLVQVDVTIIDQKTALENQVLGSYEEIGKDMMLLASVRSVDKEGRLKRAPDIPLGKKEAIRARQRQEFNRDDIEQFKRTQVAGEGNEGLLVFFETERTRTDAAFRERVRALIDQENEDRVILLKRIVATNETFSEGDLPKVQKIFASLNRDNARPGDKIQMEDGKWAVK